MIVDERIDAQAGVAPGRQHLDEHLRRRQRVPLLMIFLIETAAALVIIFVTYVDA